MSLLSPKRTLLVGVAIILAVNAIALGGVAYNRSGQPDSVLRLSQRELQRPIVWERSEESSGVALRLQWRVPVGTTDDHDSGLQQISYRSYNRAPEWLDTAKLTALGFDTRQPMPRPDEDDNYQREPRREVFLVLELDGPAYRQSLAQVRRLAAATKTEDDDTKAAVLKEEHESTRLFAIDAGVDAEALRATYPDRAHYAIVRATIRPQWSYGKPPRTLSASIEALSVEEINVPKALQPVFPEATGRVGYASDDENRAPFEAVVAFGKRQEPWMVRASAGGPGRD